MSTSRISPSSPPLLRPSPRILLHHHQPSKAVCVSQDGEYMPHRMPEGHNTFQIECRKNAKQDGCEYVPEKNLTNNVLKNISGSILPEAMRITRNRLRRVLQNEYVSFFLCRLERTTSARARPAKHACSSDVGLLGSTAEALSMGLPDIPGWILFLIPSPWAAEFAQLQRRGADGQISKSSARSRRL